MAPAHPHPTGVAVYPALFSKNFKNFCAGHIFKKSLKIFLEFVQLDMVKTNAPAKKKYLS